MQRKRSWRIPKLFRQCVYVPPPNASSTSPNLPETVDDIQAELTRKESLLSRIHSELNAGAVTKKREDELWETQRVVTQLKRKLRTFEKKRDSMHKSIDSAASEAIDFTLRRPETSANHEDASVQNVHKATAAATADAAREPSLKDDKSDDIGIAENGLYMLPRGHPDYAELIRLQLENQELMDWKHQLQARINLERAECVRLKKLLDNRPQTPAANTDEMTIHADEAEYEKLIANYIKENTLLEQKRILLAKEIFDENLTLIQLQVDLAMKEFAH